MHDAHAVAQLESELALLQSGIGRFRDRLLALRRAARASGRAPDFLTAYA